MTPHFCSYFVASSTGQIRTSNAPKTEHSASNSKNSSLQALSQFRPTIYSLPLYHLPSQIAYSSFHINSSYITQRTKSPVLTTLEGKPTQNNHQRPVISLIMFNARSIVNKLHSLRRLVISSNPDIILVTETWLTEETPSEQVSIVGYQSFRSNRLNRRGGGCLAYVKHSLSPKPFHHPTTDKIQDSIWFLVPLHQVELLVGCLYRPPNNRTDDLKPIIDAFNYIADLPCCSKIIAGDFNAPQISWNSCTTPPKFLDFVSCIRVGQWTQQVKSPTRGNNCLDLIFTLGLSEVETKVVNHFPGSDHKVVTCNFIALRKQTGANTSSRPFHLINWTLFADIIRKLNWDQFFLTSDPQLATDVLYANLHHALNLLTPPSINSKRHGRNFGLTKMKESLLKLQSSFSKSRDFSLILRMDRLSQAILRDTERQLREQEHKALAKPNRSVHLSTLLKCRNPPPASSISYIILPGRNILGINLPPHTIDSLKKSMSLHNNSFLTHLLCTLQLL
ncbi:endonuclease/exonuclease/phosphatase family protein [Streptococcus dysgalactiae]|uniref:endonuclease/exonuclease/phosphatase family protein n=1 Tax=Streptococcus dysgalactiae TaxID=1334 RepID=UPI0019514F33|nr:endonuclease/exonuclease/phosphatase family protein [Streptococcus dysgalactiae subsp. equisimilis]